MIRNLNYHKKKSAICIILQYQCKTEVKKVKRLLAWVLLPFPKSLLSLAFLYSQLTPQAWHSWSHVKLSLMSTGVHQCAQLLCSAQWRIQKRCKKLSLGELAAGNYVHIYLHVSSRGKAQCEGTQWSLLPSDTVLLSLARKRGRQGWCCQTHLQKENGFWQKIISNDWSFSPHYHYY